jgi:hypothetical protein
MSQPSVPRLPVLLLAALILALPAGLALAGDYRYGADGRVLHHHTLTYDVYNGIGSGDTQLHDQVSQAAWDWNGKPDQVIIPIASDPNNAEVIFNRSNLGQNNAAVVWASWQHATNTTASFNSYYSDNMSADEKQGHACKVIGKIMGLADAGSARDDCMEDPTTYHLVHAQSVNLVDDYYSSLRPQETLSGSLKDAAGITLSAARYNLHIVGTKGVPIVGASAGGEPAITDITVQVDSHSPLNFHQDCANGSCSFTKDWTFKTGGYATGPHTITVMSKDGLGMPSVDKSVTVIVPTPDTTIDSGPSGPTNNASPSFTFSSPQGFSGFDCRLDGGAWASCSSSKSYSSLSDGQHTFYVRARDIASTVDATPASRTFTVDTQSPTLQLSGALKQAADLNQTLTSSRYGLTASATDASNSSGVTGLELTIDDDRYEYATQECNESSQSCPLSRNWQLVVGGESPGLHDVAVTATDGVGHTTTQQLTVTIADSASCYTGGGQSSGTSAITALEATQLIDQTSPQTLAPSTNSVTAGVTLRPTVQAGGNSLAFADAGLQGQIADAPGCGFGYLIGDDFPVVFMPTATGGSATAPHIAHSDSAVFANTAQASDTAIRPVAQGVDAAIDARTSQAPTSYVWRVMTPGDEHLQANADGSVDIIATIPGDTVEADGNDAKDASALQQQNTTSLNSEAMYIQDLGSDTDPPPGDNPVTIQEPSQTKAVGTFQPPTAIDSDSSPVPTSLAASGDELTLTIQHNSFSHPVIADEPVSVDGEPVYVQLAADAGLDDSGDADPGGFWPPAGEVDSTISGSFPIFSYNSSPPTGGAWADLQAADGSVQQVQESWQCRIDGPLRPAHISPHRLNSYGDMECSGDPHIISFQRFKVCIEHHAHFASIIYWPNNKCDSESAPGGRSSMFEDVTTKCRKGKHFRASNEGYLYSSHGDAFPVYKSRTRRC